MSVVDRSVVKSSSMHRAVRALAAAGLLSATMLSGCYVVPATPDGRPMQIGALPPGPLLGGPVPQTANAGSTMMTARLYPQNDVAAKSGVLQGTVVSHNTGKGEIQLSYEGELLSGEATRLANNSRRGIANASGGRGTFLSCEYTMSAPTRGTGTCTLSNGGSYQLHIGS